MISGDGSVSRPKAQRIDGSSPHGWRGVDDYDIEIRQGRLQLPAEQEFSIDFLRLQQVIGFDVDGVGEEMELRTNLNEVAADLLHLVDQQAMGRQVQLVEIDPKPGAQISLLIQVDGKRPIYWLFLYGMLLR